MKSEIDIKTSRKNIEYFYALKFMEKKVEKILDNNENEMMWFLNHNHVYTCGTKIHPGTNVSRGGDDTLFATADGVVKFSRKGRKRKIVSVVN